MSYWLKRYFKNMFKGIDDNICLDDEQIAAIVADDDYALIIAGAGTGKTTTMAAKVKYLVDIKKVDPSKILVMSYTKKTTKDLEKLIVESFGIPAHVTTFHSLGYKYISKIFEKRKCIIIEENERDEIFLEYMMNVFPNKKRINNIINMFKHTLQDKSNLFSQYFVENFDKYNSYDEFFVAYKDKKINEAKNIGLETVIKDWVDKKINGETIITIKGEVVKSAAEAIIANFLFKHGIDYSYEKVYSEIMEDRKTYRPDFTLNIAGQDVYLEYFGLNNEKYNKIRKKKIQFHKNKKNKFIFIDRLPLNKIEQVLDQNLKKLNVLYSDKSDLEIYEQILDNNKLANVFNFKKLLYLCVDKIKENDQRENIETIIKDYILTLNDIEKQQAYNQISEIIEFYKFYQKKLHDSEIYRFDYADLIYYSNKYFDRINDISEMKYEYIIIDEYQDISQGKYYLAKNTADKNKSKVFAVGDDWQSIYSFSGSKIEYIYDFNKYFEGAKQYKISKTYRNSQELIDASGEFILKNQTQIKKALISDKHLDNPVLFVNFDSFKEGFYDKDAEYKCLKNTICKIHNENPEHNILILARKNKTIDYIFNDPSFKDDLDTKIKFIEYDDLEIDGMTMHKSKGLTYDEVIIIGLNKFFPSYIENEFWLIELLKNRVANEGIAYPEERRLFYVALTRSKNHVYILKNINPKLRSPFVDELESIFNEQTI